MFERRHHFTFVQVNLPLVENKLGLSFSLKQFSIITQCLKVTLIHLLSITMSVSFFLNLSFVVHSFPTGKSSCFSLYSDERTIAATYPSDHGGTRSITHRSIATFIIVILFFSTCISIGIVSLFVHDSKVFLADPSWPDSCSSPGSSDRPSTSSDQVNNRF